MKIIATAIMLGVLVGLCGCGKPESVRQPASEAETVALEAEPVQSETNAAVIEMTEKKDEQPELVTELKQKPVQKEILKPVQKEVQKEIAAEKKPQAIIRGFEGVGKWKVAAWGDPAKASSVNDPMTEGKAALRVKSTKPKDGKIVLSAPAATKNLAAYDRIQLDIMLDAEKSYAAAVTIALLGKVDGKFVWLESAPRALTSGWNRNIGWQMLAPEWKAESSGWHYSVAPASKAKDATVQILVHGLDQGEAVVIDNLRIDLAKADASIPADVSVEKWQDAMNIESGSHEDADVARAHAIRAYVLGTFSQYGTDLVSLGRAGESKAIFAVVDKGLSKNPTPRKHE